MHAPAWRAHAARTVNRPALAPHRHEAEEHLAIAAALCLGATAASRRTPLPAKPAAKPAAAEEGRPGARDAAAADADQLAAADRTLLATYQCEFSQSIDDAMNPKSSGYVDVKHQKQVWTMKPVLSSTGALRLEDVRARRCCCRSPTSRC